MADLDDLNRELVAIIDRLNALPDDAFAERAELRARQAQLRDQAARFHTDWDAERATGDLLEELDALRHRLREIEKSEIDLVVQSGSTASAGPGADAWGAVQINQSIDAAQGAPAIRARIERINGILADRNAVEDA